MHLLSSFRYYKVWIFLGHNCKIMGDAAQILRRFSSFWLILFNIILKVGLSFQVKSIHISRGKLATNCQHSPLHSSHSGEESHLFQYRVHILFPLDINNLFCWQLEASIKNGDIQGFQIFNEAAKRLSSIRKSDKTSAEVFAIRNKD